MVIWKYIALLATLSGVLLSFSGHTLRPESLPLWKRLRPLGWTALLLASMGILAGAVLINLEHEREQESNQRLVVEQERADTADRKRERILDRLVELQETVSQVVQRGQQTTVTKRSEAQQELTDVQAILNRALGTGHATIEVVQNTALCDKHLPFGMPAETSPYLFCRRGYALSFNLATNIADWVAYVIDPGLAQAKGDRPDTFFLDPSLPAGRGPDNRIYVNNDYDRGHLVFSRDLAGAPDLRKEAFIYSAVAPQAYRLNRGAWLAAERISHDAAVDKGHRILVYAGPILPSGPISYYRDLVVMPEAYFRVMVDLENLSAVAVIIPNTNDPPPLPQDLGNFLVSIDEVERRTGLDFLSTIDDGIEQRIEGITADAPAL